MTINDFPVQLPGAKADTLMWANPWDVEPAALDQLRNISKLPWIEKLRVMPDVHLGKGATVGSVIAMRDAVSPSAVGVDIGCVDGDSEYLGPDGWRRIADYTGGPVMQYDPKSGTGSLIDPSAYIVKDAPFFYRLKSKYGIDQMLTPDHKVLCWRIVGRDRRREMAVMSAEDFVARDRERVIGFRAEFATTFFPQLDTKIELSDDQLRVQIMVSADAHLERGTVAVLHLMKQRKIERARKLLNAAAIPFTEHFREAGGTTSIRFVPPVLSKDLSFMWEASAAQLEIIADECLLWDGNIDERCYYTRVRGNADFIQYAFTACGYRAVLRADKHKRDGKVDYRVFAQTNVMVSMAGHYRTPITEVPSDGAKAYCFTVPTGFWVMRRNGNVVMTGNCGMAAVKTNLTVNDLPDSLRPLRNAIEAAVPVGYNGHDGTASNVRKDQKLNREYTRLFGRFRDLRAVGIQERETRALSQCGSLGSGNHFCELCADDDGVLWVMLHSGSRNIGKELAERHIATAKMLEHNLGLPDRDLAVFLAGTDEMAAYLHDLYWAQDYARLSRAIMLGLVKDVVRKYLPSVVFTEEVHCHHNYVSEETYDGQDLIVTRKGAIRAGSGEMGLIPGSMGTGSFVVRGLGNELSLNSASHGAGRRMSRSRAKREFTVDDLIEQTKGVECRKDSGVVDEIPGAYKSLDEVMSAQADLVEIRYKLETLLCVKG